VGRTFIEPRQTIRHFGVKIKLNPVRDVLKGKRVVVVDDSIVRGTTSKKIIKMIRNAGASEIHMRISSPPTMFPCYYGIDTPTRQELIASSHNIEEIRKYITRTPWIHHAGRGAEGGSTGRSTTASRALARLSGAVPGREDASVGIVRERVGSRRGDARDSIQETGEHPSPVRIFWARL